MGHFRRHHADVAEEGVVNNIDHVRLRGAVLNESGLAGPCGWFPEEKHEEEEHAQSDKVDVDVGQNHPRQKRGPGDEKQGQCPDIE